MDSFTKNLRTTYDWSIDRMNELCTDGDIEQLKDAVSIRQEFAEWLLRENKEINHDIISLEYIGENSEYDICLLYTSPSPRDPTKSRMPSSA